MAADDREMSLTEHLDELRNRILLVLAVLGAAFLAGFFFTKPVLHWLILRSQLTHLIVTGVTEAFFSLLKVDLAMAAVVVSPLVFYQAAAFVFPGLTPPERRVVKSLLFPGLLLFLGGMALGFFVFVPVVLHVMLSYTGNGILPMWTLSNYLGFVIDLTVPFGIVMEMPLLAGAFARLGLLDPSLFRRFRRYAVLIAFFISAILAPPDALSMAVMAVPIYLIYELSYVIAKFSYRPPVPYDPNFSDIENDDR